MRPAKGLRDFLWLREIRNRNRSFMTGSRDVIGLWQQFRFWRSRPEVYIAEFGGRRAGYLLLRDLFITECVDAPFRRLWIGSQMIEFAKTKRDTLLAVIRDDNEASIQMHLANGFVYTGGLYVWNRDANY